MDKSQLVGQLRQRQYELGIAPQPAIDALTDDDIIDCYITCSGCGNKFIPERELPTAIERARDVDEFLLLSSGHSHR